MSSSMFKCHHCGITMTGSENYQQHLAGRKHLKAIKAAGTSLSDSVTSSTNEPAKAFSGQFVAHSVGTDNHSIAPTETDKAQDILVTDPVMNAVKANLLGTVPLKRPAYDRKCDICNIDYTSKSQEELHLSGKKHKHKAQTQAGQSIKSATLYCGFCNLQVNSVVQMDHHRNGTAHKDKVDNARLLQQQTADVTCTTDQVMNAVTASPVEDDHMCDICKLKYTSKNHEAEHLSGKKHKHKLLTLDASTSDTLFCGFCSIQVNSVEQMQQHTSGKSHNIKVARAGPTAQEIPHSAAKKKFVPSSGTQTLESDELIPPPNELMQI